MQRITQGTVNVAEPRQHKEQDELIQDTRGEDIAEIEEVPEKVAQPVKRGRGRPRKTEVEPVVEQPKRKRGRPRKVIEEPEKEETTFEEDTILPGFENNEEDTILPGFGEEEDTILPGFGEEEEEENTILPGFNDEEEEENTTLPGFNEEEEEEDTILPGFSDEEEEEDTILQKSNRNQIEDQYTNVLNNLRMENEQDVKDNNELLEEKVEYPELDINNIIRPNQKLVAFVGTSKNGTSFLVNNVAEILSMNGIDTAILDLTQNRNAYYIYTKNEDELRNQSNYIMNNLKIGKANGIEEHKNLTIYTSPFENDENLGAVEPIVETLLAAHTVVLMDCDFTTPMRYFKYAQEIYLVQSMDILTIQPLTAFLRQLSDKGMFEESKARVVLNKFIKTKEISEEILIGGISIYNDAAMTVRKELFNRKTVQHITIPFDLKSYLRYLDGLVTCDVSLKGYTKEFLQSLKDLAGMVYKSGKKETKYMPPSVKNNSNNNGFSPRMNNTLNQMKKNY